jgi:peptidoglycan hydrolase CwlO-like protein
MEDTIQQLITSGPVGIIAAAVVYVIVYLQRNSTKADRDKDSQELHDAVLKIQFKLSELDGRTVHHAEILDSLSQQINILNNNLSLLTQKLDYLNEYIKEIKQGK